MSSGDVVLQVTNVSVPVDESERDPAILNTANQVTEFSGGTFIVPTSGVSVQGTIRVPLRRTGGGGPGGSSPETLFDSNKLYKITIEEV